MALQARKLRLTHITTVPQSLAFMQGQVGYVRDHGFEVQAISSGGDLLHQFGRDEHVLTSAVDMERRISPMKDLGAIFRVVGALRSFKPDIVHAHTPKGGLLGMISSWLLRVRIRVYHIRGLPYQAASGRKRSLLRLTERISCRLAHRVFCVSASVRDIAIADGICPPEKIVVFGGGSGNGVDAEERFNPDRFSAEFRSEFRDRHSIGASAVVIGFVGRLVRDKGIHELAAAWSQIKDRYPNTHLVMVGPIETQDPVDPHVLDVLREDTRVHFTGMVDDTAPYFSIFDFLVLPTYREGFGNVNIEAAAMGVPVISTLIPGCVDSVQDGVTGMLVPVRDVDALVGAMQIYLDNPGMRRDHGLAGRERVLRDFRPEAIWKAIHLEYLQLLSEARFRLPASE